MPARRHLVQEAVVSEASVFRLFAEEAMRAAANAVSEDERRALEELAFIWAKAALVSDRTLRSRFTSLPDFGDTVPLSRSGQVKNEGSSPRDGTPG
jgi:hypothetical protein